MKKKRNKRKKKETHVWITTTTDCSFVRHHCIGAAWECVCVSVFVCVGTFFKVVLYVDGWWRWRMVRQTFAKKIVIQKRTFWVVVSLVNQNAIINCEIQTRRFFKRIKSENVKELTKNPKETNKNNEYVN